MIDKRDWGSGSSRMIRREEEGFESHNIRVLLKISLYCVCVRNREVWNEGLLTRELLPSSFATSLHS